MPRTVADGSSGTPSVCGISTVPGTGRHREPKAAMISSSR